MTKEQDEEWKFPNSSPWQNKKLVWANKSNQHWEWEIIPTSLLEKYSRMRHEKGQDFHAGNVISNIIILNHLYLVPIFIHWEATIETWGKAFFSAHIYWNPPSVETR